jgi:hypothetical protein
MTTYGHDAILQDAQSTLDQHSTNQVTGRCAACGTVACARREAATRVFSRYNLLPLRRHELAPAPSGYRRVY